MSVSSASLEALVALFERYYDPAMEPYYTHHHVTLLSQLVLAISNQSTLSFSLTNETLYEPIMSAPPHKVVVLSVPMIARLVNHPVTPACATVRFVDQVKLFRPADVAAAVAAAAAKGPAEWNPDDVLDEAAAYEYAYSDEYQSSEDTDGDTDDTAAPPSSATDDDDDDDDDTATTTTDTDADSCDSSQLSRKARWLREQRRAERKKKRLQLRVRRIQDRQQRALDDTPFRKRVPLRRLDQLTEIELTVTTQLFRLVLAANHYWLHRRDDVEFRRSATDKRCAIDNPYQLANKLSDRKKSRRKKKRKRSKK